MHTGSPIVAATKKDDAVADGIVWLFAQSKASSLVIATATNVVLNVHYGIVSSGNAWGRCSQSYFDSGNGVPRNAKPALGELYKKHPVCTEIRLFEIQNQNFFLGRLFPSGQGTPPPHSYPHRRRKPCTYGTLSPQGSHLLILELPVFGSHTSFFRKRSLVHLAWAVRSTHITCCITLPE